MNLIKLRENSIIVCAEAPKMCAKSLYQNAPIRRKIGGGVLSLNLDFQDSTLRVLCVSQKTERL